MTTLSTEIYDSSKADLLHKTFDLWKEGTDIVDEDMIETMQEDLRFVSAEDPWIGCLDEKGELLGIARISLWPTHSEIREIFVPKTNRRMGVGTALMDRICKETLEKGGKEVKATIVDEAKAFYASHAFTHAGDNGRLGFHKLLISN